MKKFLKSALVCAFALGLSGIVNPIAAKAESLPTNQKTMVTVNKDETVIYDVSLNQGGMFNLTVSTTSDDRSDIYIKVLDANNKELIADSGHWSKNSLNDSLNDLNMPIQLAAGSYKVSFTYEGDAYWSYEVYPHYLPTKKISYNTSWKEKLYRGEQAMYKVTVPEAGYYNIQSSAADPYDIDFYILDKNGNEIDDDDRNPDWSSNKVSGVYKMNWKTESMKKGTYYIKICNKTSGIVEFPVKITYKIPATKLTLKKSLVTLKKNGKYTIKATFSGFVVSFPPTSFSYRL